MEISELEQLVGLVQQSGVSELTLKQADKRVTIRRTHAPVAGTALVPVSAVYESVEYEIEQSDEDAEYSASPEITTIIAPLVGVFHPVKPMVGLGAKITAGQTVGVIEAMKLINEVTAATSGTVTDMLVEDGMPVEYGQPLFYVETTE